VKKMPDRNWTMAINWARIIGECESVTGLTPSQQDIEAALDMVEKEVPENELYSSEVEDTEQAIITRLLKVIRRNRGKDIKKVKPQKEPEAKPAGLPDNMDVQFFGPFGNGSLKDLKDMGFEIDPAMMEGLTKSIMDGMLGKKKKKKPDDEENEDEKKKSDDDDPGASFYT
jgi:hypothetical protein